MSTRTRTIYEELEKARKDKGLSQRAAAAALKTTPTTWRQWGRGQTPGWDWIKRFQRFTGLSRDEVVDAIAEHARRHPELVVPLTAPLGRLDITWSDGTPVEVESGEWFDRPIEIFAESSKLKVA